LSTGDSGPQDGGPENDNPENGQPESTPTNGNVMGGRFIEASIEDELKESYLTYAMSVIISRALPDVRDGLKPSQRRILVAMNDLGLAPGGATSKCAGIVGETMKRYHPHGDAAIYPTLVRMGQEWATRYMLIDKQGNFGSIAGLPPAQMRYTEAKLSNVSVEMLDDYKLDTVDFVPNYDDKLTEPSVLPSKFPNLLVNGSQGIAVGMATSIPPHNLSEVCDALMAVIDNPDISVDEIMEIMPGPDFPTGGQICGRSGIRRGYHTGRGTIILRGEARIEEHKKGRHRIVISGVPYQQTRDRVYERISELVADGRIEGISPGGMTDESDLEEPVRLVLELKNKADPDVALNQLYQFSPLQESFSIILLALVDGKPRILSIKNLLQEFVRHRVTVIRRRTQHLLMKARQRKHTVEGLLLAQADIDEIIRIIRTSSTQAEAKTRLMGIEVPAQMMARALGERGYAEFTRERGEAATYSLTGVQADAILRMTLGSLVNLEQEKLAKEHNELLDEIVEYLRILSSEENILAIIKADLAELKRRFGDKRRTEITGEEVGSIDLEDLIEEETMVVTLSTKGYIKRTPSSTYRAQRRGGKGLKGAATEEEDPIQNLFVASTHDYLMFFTNKGKCYWQKVYDLPQLAREARGRAIVNLLSLAEGETVASCLAIRDFTTPEHYLVMVTRRGQVKKTALDAYGRPKKNGLIAINLREGDELVSVAVAGPGDEIMLASARGQLVRFRHTDARPMGRNASGVRGIKLRAGDELVGMVIADPDATLLTACQNGYGKRTWIGANHPLPTDDSASDGSTPVSDEEVEAEVEAEAASEPDEAEESGEVQGYPTKSRGTMGVRDIKATTRNGPVIGITIVSDEDEVMMMTSRGKIQRIRAADINVIGRNTQGVRIMSLDEDDTLAAIVRVPPEEEVAAAPEGAAPTPPPPMADEADGNEGEVEIE
jgi:DNA gyrase subunit A